MSPITETYPPSVFAISPTFQCKFQPKTHHQSWTSPADYPVCMYMNGNKSQVNTPNLRFPLTYISHFHHTYMDERVNCAVYWSRRRLHRVRFCVEDWGWWWWCWWLVNPSSAFVTQKRLYMLSALCRVAQPPHVWYTSASHIFVQGSQRILVILKVPRKRLRARRGTGTDSEIRIILSVNNV